MQAKDQLILNLPDVDYELFRYRLLKNWKAGKLQTSKLSPLEIEIIKEHCLTDIDWNNGEPTT